MHKGNRYSHYAPLILLVYAINNKVVRDALAQIYSHALYVLLVSVGMGKGCMYI